MTLYYIRACLLPLNAHEPPPWYEGARTSYAFWAVSEILKTEHFCITITSFKYKNRDIILYLYMRTIYNKISPLKILFHYK